MGTARRGVDDDPPPHPPFDPLRPITLGWYRAARCLNGSCVEARQFDHDRFGLRDSKQNDLGPDQPIVWLSRAGYLALLDEVAGRVPPGSNTEVAVVVLDDGDTIIRCLTSDVELRYDRDETAAWIDGVLADEFGPALAPS